MVLRAEPISVTAVPAVAAVRRAEVVQPPRELRGTDALASGYPRPAAATFPADDVARFQRLVFGQAHHTIDSTARDVPGVAEAPLHPHRPMLGQAQSDHWKAVTPADRIAATLHHLAVVRGL